MTSGRRSYDVVVVGAGAFGAWTSLMLRRSGRTVLLVDAYGPANSRASSGGESRVIRSGYGADDLYARWAHRSLTLWKELASETREHLFYETGVLWMARPDDALSTSTLATLKSVHVPHERIERAELDGRWPQIDFGPVTWGIFEPMSGVLMARRAVNAAVRQAVSEGVEFRIAAASAPPQSTHVASLELAKEPVAAGAFVFALGPWLGKVFPAILGERIFTTRQEVFYFGTPPGDVRFAPPAMPVWIDFGAEIYGIPDIEGKGFKVAPDRHGPPFDPDSGERVVTPAGTAVARECLDRRFPALKGAPLVGSEVCQYENTSNGDFLIDRHPVCENVWLVGGGSGHGFKHGPAVGEYVAARLADGKPPEERFSLATKAKKKRRAIF